MTSGDLVVNVPLVAGAALATAIDLRTRRVPNALTLSMAVTGLGIAALGFGSFGPGAAIAGGILGLALMLPGHLFGGTGAGDVKLFAAFGTLLGPAPTVRAFFFTALAGGLLALVVAARRRLVVATLSRTARLIRQDAGAAVAIESVATDNRFAYAPAIAIGGLLAVLS